MRAQVHEKILQCNIKCACVCVCMCVCVRVCKCQKRYYSVASYMCARVQVPEKILQLSLMRVRVCKWQRRSYSVASCVCVFVCASAREDPTE